MVGHFEVDAAAFGSGERAALGRYGEIVAADHLVASGMTVLARNWRCREGEVDIVALDGDVLVMCEVKTRRGVGFGTPLDAVTPVKAARLRRLALRWLAEQRAGVVEGTVVARYAEIRFDVISVLRPLSGPTVVDHLRGAF
ncbi:MAG TPA: YraN family protein [Acidothermaceae bacterium]